MSERTVEWCVMHDAPMAAAPWLRSPSCWVETDFRHPRCRFVTAPVLVPDEGAVGAAVGERVAEAELR